MTFTLIFLNLGPGVQLLQGLDITGSGSIVRADMPLSMVACLYLLWVEGTAT